MVNGFQRKTTEVQCHFHHCMMNLFKKFIYLFFWLFWVLIAACRLFLVVVSRASLQCMGSRLTGFRCCILQQDGSIIVAHRLSRLSFSAARGIFPDKGWNLGCLHWECRELATGPPSKSPLPITIDLSKTGTWLTGHGYLSLSPCKVIPFSPFHTVLCVNYYVQSIHRE